MLAIPAYFEESGNEVILKMALRINRRACISKLWEENDIFKFKMSQWTPNGKFGIISYLSQISDCFTPVKSIQSQPVTKIFNLK